MIRLFYKKDGFTLIELLIVVAIIGILAAIAIPNFLRFQAKSKQAEVKANLGALHTSLDTFRGEYGSYTTDLYVIGWSPSGSPRYNYGFSTDNPNPGGAITGITVVGSRNSADAVLPASQLTMMKDSNGSQLLAGDLPPSTASQTAFTIGAVGNLDNDPINDQWYLTQGRVLNNLVNDVGS